MKRYVCALSSLGNIVFIKGYDFAKMEMAVMMAEEIRINLSKKPFSCLKKFGFVVLDEQMYANVVVIDTLDNNFVWGKLVHSHSDEYLV